MYSLKYILKKVLRNNKIFSSLYSRVHLFKNKTIENTTLKEINKLEKLSPNEILNYQNKKLKEVLSIAKKNTIYYGQIFNKCNIDISDINDFKRIPFLTKNIIIKNSDNLLNTKYPLESLVKKNTGGSTGKPLEFYRTTKSGVQDYAFHFHQYSKMGYQNNDIILGAGAVVISEELRSKNIYWKYIGENQAFGDYKLSILYLNNTNIQFYVKKLVELKPAILRGYPSLFDEIARYILQHDIKIEFEIKGASLTSEMCSDTQRKNIEKAFSTKVYYEYGHSEIAVLCHSDRESYVYKSYPSYGFVEVLDENGNETRIGKIGHIVVTGFLNTGMPFIRYKTEDMGRVSYRNGGVVYFNEIVGRSQDFIITKDDNKISISALTSWQHLDAFANIDKWQITQKKKGKIDICIVKGEKYNLNDENEILNKIQQIAKIDITFIYKDNIPRTKGGKHLFLIQKLKV